uniref:C3/C5 convertase n=1 Tax=Latimeria chalumnae TaxID=7897 RepID=H3A2N3_LATCH
MVVCGVGWPHPGEREGPPKKTKTLFISFVAVSLPSSNLQVQNKQCDEKDIAIEGGNFTLSYGFEIGSTLKYICPAGMVPFPLQVRECKHSGRWTPLTAPSGSTVSKSSCKPIKCPRPVEFEFGQYYPRFASYNVGDTLEFECFEGYSLRGSSSRTCQMNGKWNGTTTICDSGSGHCHNPGIPLGASKVGTQYRINDKVKYKCEGGLILVGSSERTCLESTDWTGTEPLCRVKYTFDTPEEAALFFGASLSAVMATENLDDKENLGRKLKLEKGGKVHLYILIDASSSVGEKEFKKATHCADQLIKRIASYDVVPKFGIIAFATIPQHIIRMSDDASDDIDEVLSELENRKYEDLTDHGTGTNIDAALDEVLKMMLFLRERNKAEFELVRHLVVLLSDDIYTFGVGADIDEIELNNLASKKDGERHSFLLETYKDLEELFDQIVDEENTASMCGLAKQNKKADGQQRNPWLVSIETRRDGKVHNCKGTLISAQWVLTAAHCFTIQDKSHLVNIWVGGKLVSVSNLTLHDKYNINKKKAEGIEEFYDYDVALVKLKKKLLLGDDVRAMCIPCTEATNWALRKPRVGTTCKDHAAELLSVGLTEAFFVTEGKEKDELDRKLVRIKTTGDHKRLCNEDAKKAEFYVNVTDVSKVVTDRFLCTGGTEPQVDPNTCKGDSGGPIIISKKMRYVQVAVISWGVKDTCKIQKSFTYARDFHLNLFKVIPWLQEHLKDEEFKFIPLGNIASD